MRHITLTASITIDSINNFTTKRYYMLFIEQAYLELKAIDPSMTATKFSTNWLNKCSSYYQANKPRKHDMTLHALMCFLINLSKKANALSNV
jgi:hypothetical protein